MKKHFLSVLIAMAVSSSAFAQQEKTIPVRFMIEIQESHSLV